MGDNKITVVVHAYNPCSISLLLGSVSNSAPQAWIGRHDRRFADEWHHVGDDLGNASTAVCIRPQYTSLSLFSIRRTCRAAHS
jgi:hypothetical protein